MRLMNKYLALKSNIPSKGYVSDFDVENNKICLAGKPPGALLFLSSRELLNFCFKYKISGSDYEIVMIDVYLTEASTL